MNFLGMNTGINIPDFTSLGYDVENDIKKQNKVIPSVEEIESLNKQLESELLKELEEQNKKEVKKSKVTKKEPVKKIDKKISYTDTLEKPFETEIEELEPVKYSELTDDQLVERVLKELKNKDIKDGFYGTEKSQYEAVCNMPHFMKVKYIKSLNLKDATDEDIYSFYNGEKVDKHDIFKLSQFDSDERYTEVEFENGVLRFYNKYQNYDISINVENEKKYYEIYEIEENSKGEPKNKLRLIHSELINRLIYIFNPVYLGGFTHIYTNGRYINVSDSFLECIIRSMISEKFQKNSVVTEIMRSLKTDARVIKEFNEKSTVFETHNENLINFKNYMLDVSTMTVFPHSPNFYSTVQMKANLNLDAFEFIDNYDLEKECPVFFKTLNRIFPNKDTQKVIQEIMGLSISLHTSKKGIFIMYGNGDTGKSTIINTLMEVIEDNAVSSAPLQSFSDRFMASTIVGKRLVTCGDLPSTPIKDIGFIKGLTGGDFIPVEYKGKDKITVKGNCKFFGSSNVLIKNFAGDNSMAFYNRIMWIPCNQVIDSKEQDPFLMNKIRKEKDGIALWCVVGLNRFLANNKNFSYSEEIEKLNDQYRKENNNIERFLDEMCDITDNKMDKIYTVELYDVYKKYCEEELNETFANKKEFDAAIKMRKIGYQENGINMPRIDSKGNIVMKDGKQLVVRKNCYYGIKYKYGTSDLSALNEEYYRKKEEDRKNVMKNPIECFIDQECVFYSGKDKSICFNNQNDLTLGQFKIEEKVIFALLKDFCVINRANCPTIEELNYELDCFGVYKKGNIFYGIRLKTSKEKSKVKYFNEEVEEQEIIFAM